MQREICPLYHSVTPLHTVWNCTALVTQRYRIYYLYLVISPETFPYEHIHQICREILLFYYDVTVLVNLRHNGTRLRSLMSRRSIRRDISAYTNVKGITKDRPRTIRPHVTVPGARQSGLSRIFALYEIKISRFV